MDEDSFIQAVDDAISFSGPLSAKDKEKAFDSLADHVFVLLCDAVSCYSRASYGTSVFLAISALEETAKAEIILYREVKEPPSKGRDPLLNHRTKHKIAVRPTTFMGRLPQLIGETSCQRLSKEAHHDQLKSLREQALYVHSEESGLISPRDCISRNRAKEVVFLAMEAADDILVGYTNHSINIGLKIESLIQQMSTLDQTK